MNIWSCKIGTVLAREDDYLPRHADLPMREAVSARYEELTGESPQFIFSGWAAQLTEAELAVVEDREPDDAHYANWVAENALMDLAETAWGIIANANEGNWGEATPEWKAAAERWRDRYHDALKTHLAARRA